MDHGSFIARKEEGLKNDYIKFMLSRLGSLLYKSFVVHDVFGEILPAGLLKANDDIYIPDYDNPDQKADISNMIDTELSDL